MEILESLAHGHDRLFYTIHNTSITYKEAYRRVKELSTHLEMLEDSPIMIYGHKQIEVVIAILSCVQAKRCYIMIDSSYPISRIEEIVKASKAKYCIAIDPIQLDSMQVFTISSLLHLQQAKKITQNPIAYILYTSGSTGKPKGVPISYHNLQHFINCSTTSLKVDPLNLLSVSNFSFDLSLMDLYYALYLNCTIYAIDQTNKANYSLIAPILQSVHYIVATPTYYNFLLLDHQFNSKQYPLLQYFFSCGERLEIETAKKLKNRFPQCTLINAYGPTEATCFISYKIIQLEDLNRPLLPVGNTNTSFVDVSIVDEEIVLHGKSVFEGYISKPPLQKKNGSYLFKTGDLGLIEEDLIYVRQRKDDQIKYQGYRIELGDIETNLLKIEGIDQACVLASKKGDQVKMIKAFVTGSLKDDLIIKQQLKQYLPAYMIPKRIIILEKMPMNENGKINRKELAKQ